MLQFLFLPFMNPVLGLLVLYTLVLLFSPFIQKYTSSPITFTAVGETSPPAVALYWSVVVLALLASVYFIFFSQDGAGKTWGFATFTTLLLFCIWSLKKYGGKKNRTKGLKKKRKK